MVFMISEDFWKAPVTFTIATVSALHSFMVRELVVGCTPTSS